MRAKRGAASSGTTADKGRPRSTMSAVARAALDRTAAALGRPPMTDVAGADVASSHARAPRKNSAG